MKHILIIILLIIAASPLAQGQSQSQLPEVNAPKEERPPAMTELYEAAQAYKGGKFAEAQRHAERALELDPSSKTALTFIARSIHAQYRPGVESPENIAKAREAIAAYQRSLLIQPDNDEAFKAIAALYGGIGEDELQYSWIMQRAINGAIPAEKRAEAYAILASKDWNCSYTITEQPENKQASRKSGNENAIVYLKPKDPKAFDKAQQCATRGMEMVEAAIGLEAENSAAWSFKANLLLELAKLAEMEGDKSLRDEDTRLARDAAQRSSELQLSEDRRKEAEEALAQAQVKIIAAGALDGKAINLPQPIYPVIAKPPRAQGTVVVEVIIDEAGKVISAKAVSGHPLLRAAAVQAAQGASFSPVLGKGLPVKVSGAISYDFILPSSSDKQK